MFNTEKIDWELMEMMKWMDFSKKWDDLLTEGQLDMRAWVQRIALYIAQDKDDSTLHQLVQIAAMARTGILQEIMSQSSFYDAYDKALGRSTRS